MKVIKRDGTVVDFDHTKIEEAIKKAFNATNIKYDGLVAERVMQNIGQLTKYEIDQIDINIEYIQDIVEKELMTAYTDVAKAYILYRDERSKQRHKRTNKHPDPLALSDYIHYTKYARYLPNEQRRETYIETSHRCRDMHLRKFIKWGDTIIDDEGKRGKLIELIQWAWNFVDNKIVLPSMRSMQFGGEAIEDQNCRMYNCSFTHIDRPRVFQEIFYLLLCGCGVGFSVQKHHVDKLPIIRQRDNKKLRHHAVEDSIQGWADSIGILMDSFFIGYYVEFDYGRIRPQGSILRISGGKAPGHFPLKTLHIIVSQLLSNAHNRKLHPIEYHDIICHIADSVLSGGIRRSSLISLFSIDDEDMLYSKMQWNFQHYGENGQRALANNSAVLLRPVFAMNDEELEEDLEVKLDETLDVETLQKWNEAKEELSKQWEEENKEDFLKVMKLNKTNVNGEPGFFFTNDLDYGCNPCGEIGLYPVLDAVSNKLTNKANSGFEIIKESGIAFCNLTEVNCAKIETKEEFLEAVRAATIIGTLQAAYTDFKYLGRVTEEIVKRDALLGVSLTGMMDNPSIALDPDVQSLGAKMAYEVNKEVAELIGINPAKRLTTVKPSGTASLLLGGVASGIHPHHSKRYFRRITVNRNESVLKEFIRINPQMIEYKPNGDISLVFPIESPSGAITLKDMDVKDFLQHIFSTYDNWVKLGSICNDTLRLTHNISCTVCFKPEEYESMVETIWENRNRIASMSFIPFTSDKILPFMPRESVVTEVDELRWNELVEKYKPIDYSSLKEGNTHSDLALELACSRDNEDCGSVSVEIEDTVEILSSYTYLGATKFKYEKVGTIRDSFGNELILVRVK